MKKSLPIMIPVLVLLSLVSFALGALWFNWYHDIDDLYIKHYRDMTVIEAYEQYYNGAETLLDEINDQYDWIDGYDNYDYYEGRAKIEMLK